VDFGVVVFLVVLVDFHLLGEDGRAADVHGGMRGGGLSGAGRGSVARVRGEGAESGRGAFKHGITAWSLWGGSAGQQGIVGSKIWTSVGDSGGRRIDSRRSNNISTTVVTQPRQPSRSILALIASRLFHPDITPRNPNP